MFRKGIPTQKEIENLKKEYPKGCRVELVYMNDPYVKIPEGTKGNVTSVDDIGTIHVHWDTGHHLGIAYLEDECRKVEE